MIKKIIPHNSRIRLRALQKDLKDLIKGQRKLFIKKNSPIASFPSQIQISQPIRPNQYSKNKIHNLHLAVSFIENKLIREQQILSFWKLIPQPIKKNGFKRGRNLIGNELSLDFGGGLCQLSGIMYHLSLLAGLNIIERYPHSKDIYTEKTRYTPLGSDATIVYGYKDLRIQNSLAQPICFNFEIFEDKIIAHICAEKVILPNEIVFESNDLGDKVQSKVSRVSKAGNVSITEDVYVKLNS